ncbi:MAG: enoyl-CoA hydratase [delta proteobacterium ML8_F1]|nr:MAG: enoyl-CoA hydratase [delta proteobacterium ML8_F1]
MTSVLKEKKEKVGYIVLNRPEAYNTFNIPLATELNDALREMDEDPGVNVVVIAGAGKNFCTGIDVNFLGGKTQEEYLDWVRLMEEMNLTIAKMAKPVIASVQGIAVANGIGLVAASDLAVAEEDARFGATAVNVGLFCMGPAVPLLKTLGRKKTLELIMLGELIDAGEALRLGLVNQVVPKGTLEAATHAYALKLAEKSPLALRMGKQSFYKMEDLPFEEALESTNLDFARLSGTEDALEGVEAFLNKRPPVWKMK